MSEMLSHPRQPGDLSTSTDSTLDEHVQSMTPANADGAAAGGGTRKIDRVSASAELPPLQPLAPHTFNTTTVPSNNRSPQLNGASSSNSRDHISNKASSSSTKKSIRRSPSHGGAHKQHHHRADSLSPVPPEYSTTTFTHYSGIMKKSSASPVAQNSNSQLHPASPRTMKQQANEMGGNLNAGARATSLPLTHSATLQQQQPTTTTLLDQDDATAAAAAAATTAAALASNIRDGRKSVSPMREKSVSFDLPPMMGNQQASSNLMMMGGSTGGSSSMLFGHLQQQEHAQAEMLTSTSNNHNNNTGGVVDAAYAQQQQQHGRTSSASPVPPSSAAEQPMVMPHAAMNSTTKFKVAGMSASFHNKLGNRVLVPDEAVTLLPDNNHSAAVAAATADKSKNNNSSNKQNNILRKGRREEGSQIQIGSSADENAASTSEINRSAAEEGSASQVGDKNNKHVSENDNNTASDEIKVRHSNNNVKTDKDIEEMVAGLSSYQELPVERQEAIQRVLHKIVAEIKLLKYNKVVQQQQQQQNNGGGGSNINNSQNGKNNKNNGMLSRKQLKRMEKKEKKQQLKQQQREQTAEDGASTAAVGGADGDGGSSSNTATTKPQQSDNGNNSQSVDTAALVTGVNIVENANNNNNNSMNSPSSSTAQPVVVEQDAASSENNNSNNNNNNRSIFNRISSRIMPFRMFKTTSSGGENKRGLTDGNPEDPAADMGTKKRSRDADDDDDDDNDSAVLVDDKDKMQEEETQDVTGHSNQQNNTSMMTNPSSSSTSTATATAALTNETNFIHKQPVITADAVSQSIAEFDDTKTSVFTTDEEAERFYMRHARDTGKHNNTNNGNNNKGGRRGKQANIAGQGGTFRKSELIGAYRQLVREGAVKPSASITHLLMKKRGKSHSGVLVVTVLMGPGQFSCPKNCHYCPDQPGIARSYLLKEPGVLRGFRNNWDPILQFYDRCSALENNGHVVDKIELLILGGTFSFYPKEYQEEFIGGLYYAANTYHSSPPIRPMMSVQEEIRINETAECRIIGLTTETRPDYITMSELRRFRHLGVTRVQIGIQHLDDDVLRAVNRECPTSKTIVAIQRLLDAGFKVDAHWMPDLPGSTFEKDMKLFQHLLSDEDAGEGKNVAFQVDQWKVYPTMTVPFTKIKEWYDQGKYEPYAEKENGKLMVDLLAYILEKTPYRIRLNRIVRDIPNSYIVGGENRVNLRQLMDSELLRRNIQCRDIRTRECKGKPIHRNQSQLFVDVLEASEGKEFYLSIEDRERKTLYGHLRLRLRARRGRPFNFDNVVNDDPTPSSEGDQHQSLQQSNSGKHINDDDGSHGGGDEDDAPFLYEDIFPCFEGAALIREVHTYGRIIAVNRTNDKNLPSLRPQEQEQQQQPKEDQPSSTTEPDAVIADDDDSVTHDTATAAKHQQPTSNNNSSSTPSGDSNNNSKASSAQHVGIGQELMKKAEEIARSHGYYRTVVIAGVGVRHYYAKLGYRLQDTYMVKDLERTSPLLLADGDAADGKTKSGLLSQFVGKVGSSLRSYFW